MLRSFLSLILSSARNHSRLTCMRKQQKDHRENTVVFFFTPDAAPDNPMDAP